MKYLFVILIPLLFSQFLSSQNSFSAKLKVPQEILQGEYTEISLDIYKPEGTRNYTVFTQELPAGFFVKVVDIQGASYTHENNILTLTWMRSPAKSKFTVKYKIASMVGITGEFNLSGKLTYMAGSSQGIFNLKTQSFKVVKDKTSVVNNNSNEENQYSIKYINTKLKDVSCKRKITFHEKKAYYEVELFIKKKKSGSYTIVEKIPKNYKFSEIESQDAKIRQKSDLVQYMWVKIPKGDEIVIKYKLISSIENNTFPLIRGKLSFLDNGQILNLTITDEE